MYKLHLVEGCFLCTVQFQYKQSVFKVAFSEFQMNNYTMDFRHCQIAVYIDRQMMINRSETGIIIIH